MGKSEIEAFLNYLVRQRHLSASSQSQALNAIIFMYKQVLELDPGWPDNLARAKRKHFLPTVLSVNEVREILGHMQGMTRLMAALIYGTGMRVNECCQLRIKDIDFDMRTITVRQGKGGKDRPQEAHRLGHVAMRYRRRHDPDEPGHIGFVFEIYSESISLKMTIQYISTIKFSS